jgi:hypothetical protein
MESDIAEIVVRRDGTYWPKFANKKYPQPHQGTREMQRRQRQIGAVDGGATTQPEAV